MTPGIKAAEAAGLNFSLHQYPLGQGGESWGMEASEKLGVEPARVFKTLIAQLDNGELLAGLVPVDTKLNLKALAKAAGGKKASMAEARLVERSTGYILGGVCPLGQKKALRTFVDESARQCQTVFVSAGRRGLEIELSPSDLLALTGGQYSPLRQT
ncbi:Cys-tRNA(Pro) deacylase [Marinobacter sp. CHS3-4]|uniref:Cys-tRNA(Pro) deacylase n=1 Tax=Marinobacter sp. CHS3-4 TaxID=3045174 RepID=UPI0024B586B1|nr:Cys-tRNA(Pro) deacylase [Marinobacter sp. CHS3-4]MDI9243715.1 Cys-tRNA(Pro) deacylase [Marinobacter sp. CHS3-4]